MFGNLLLGLTSTTYLALIIFNLQKVNATGERLMGYAFIGFVIMAAYAVSGLLLTIFITSKGGFNWLSDTKTLRNIGVGILWSGMVAGVVCSGCFGSGDLCAFFHGSGPNQYGEPPIGV